MEFIFQTNVPRQFKLNAQRHVKERIFHLPN